jgi:hypothetical protein
MATGDLLGLTVTGATPIDPDAGGVGIDGNGWVAELVIEGLAPGGTFDPAQVVLTVQDPGFDAAGSVTRTRTIRGGAVLRRQYPNHATPLVVSEGGNLKASFSLDDDIYAGSTIVAASIGGGVYPGTNAGSPASIVNGSTRAYPKPLFAWLNAQHERATAPSFAVEAVAYHRHAMLGRQVARVEFTARDAGSGVAAMQVASLPALSDFQTKGFRVEAWKAAIPLADLAQGQVCQVNARIYPWIGDAGAVLDLDTDGVAWPTAQAQTRLRFLNDRTGGYGGAYAYVKAGVTGGVVSADPAAARATPFPTINAALAALPAWNNANRGHNDHSGATVRLMDDGAGGAVAHEPAAAMNPVAGNCLTTIEADPLNSAAASMSLTATRATSSMLRWCVPIAVQGAFHLDGGSNANNNVAVYDGITLSQTTGSVPINYRQGLTYWRNVTISGMSHGSQSPFYNAYAATRTQWALALGCVCVDASTNFSVLPVGALVGCDFRRGSLGEYNRATYTQVDPADGVVIANNRLLDARVASPIVHSQDYVRGAAIVQNVLERANGASAAAIQISGDGAVNEIDNIVLQHNTLPGTDTVGRLNIAYADVAGAVGKKKRATLRFNLFDDFNAKGDLFTGTTTATGRVGNWAMRHSVGAKGNVAGGSTAGGDTVPAATSWLGEYWEPSSTASATPAYVDNKGGAAAVGGGDYHLTGESNPGYGRVPAGLQALAYDLDGQPRRDDGSGAAGVYERAATEIGLAVAGGSSAVGGEAALVVATLLSPGGGLSLLSGVALLVAAGTIQADAGVVSVRGDAVLTVGGLLAPAGGFHVIGNSPVLLGDPAGTPHATSRVTAIVSEMRTTAIRAD